MEANKTKWTRNNANTSDKKTDQSFSSHSRSDKQRHLPNSSSSPQHANYFPFEQIHRSTVPPKAGEATRTRPVKRSNTTGTPRCSSAVVGRRNRSREASDCQSRHQSTLEATSTFAGDLFVAEEGLVNLQRIRNFTTKDGALVNRGDSFRIKRGSKASGSNGDNISINDSTHKEKPQVSVESMLEVVADSQSGHRVEKRDLLKYDILVLGSSGVGKSTLISQLMTSDHVAGNDIYTQEYTNNGCNSEVAVKIDQFELMLRFLNTTEALEVQSERRGFTTTANDTYKDPDLELIKYNQSVASGFLVVYSVTDLTSFLHAETCLQELRPDKRRNLVILVANKNDLVRNRIISEADGLKLATKKQCKYIEVSAVIDHKIDELLVGIARQINLRQLPPPLKNPRAPRNIPAFMNNDNNFESGVTDDYYSEEEEENDNDVVDLQSKRRAAPKMFSFFKPLFANGAAKLRFDSSKFQSRVGSFVLGLFRKKDGREPEKNLSSAFGCHSHMANIFPAVGGPRIRSRCDDLMSP